MFFYEMVPFVSLGIVKLCLRQPRTLKSANLSYEKKRIYPVETDWLVGSCEILR